MSSISFCIPYYAGESHLRRAIDSVKAQSLEDWELVIVDDKGPNGDIAEADFIRSDSRIRYFRNDENLGLAGNWNKCLDLASSPLVTLLHADDELEANYAKIMIEARTKDPRASAYFCRASIIDDESLTVFSFPDFIKTLIMPSRDSSFILKGPAAIEQLLKGNFIFCPTLCFNSSEITNIRFDKRWKMVVDLDLVIRILQKGGRIVGLPEKYYRYRRHSNNQTTQLTASMKRFEEEIEIYREIGRYADQQKWASVSKTAFNLRMIKLHIAFLMTKDLLRLDLRSFSKKLAFSRTQKLI